MATNRMTPTPSEARQVALAQADESVLLLRAQRKELRRLLRKAKVENALLIERLAERDEEIRALRQGGEAWRPIATAPKDGSTFLVYLPGERRKVQTAWQNENGVMAVGACFAFDLTPATHWQPIPPPPAEGEAA